MSDHFEWGRTLFSRTGILHLIERFPRFTTITKSLRFIIKSLFVLKRYRSYSNLINIYGGSESVIFISFTGLLNDKDLDLRKWVVYRPILSSIVTNSVLKRPRHPHVVYLWTTVVNFEILDSIILYSMSSNVYVCVTINSLICIQCV